jgi:hypothetical protein
MSRTTSLCHVTWGRLSRWYHGWHSRQMLYKLFPLMLPLTFPPHSLNSLHISVDRLLNFPSISWSNKPISPFQRSRSTTLSPSRMYRWWRHADRLPLTVRILIRGIGSYAIRIHFVQLCIRVRAILFSEPLIHGKRVSNRILWSAIANQEYVLSILHHSQLSSYHLHHHRGNAPHTVPSTGRTTLAVSSFDVGAD